MDYCPVNIAKISSVSLVTLSVALIFVLLPLFLSGCLCYRKKQLDAMRERKLKMEFAKKNNEISFWGNAMSFLGAAIPIFISVLVEDEIIKAVLSVLSMGTMAVLLFASYKYASMVWSCMEEINNSNPSDCTKGDEK